MSSRTALTVLNDVAAAMFDAVDSRLMWTEFFGPSSPTSRDRVRQSKEPTQFDIAGVEVFQQTWGSTALGFDGIGGAAMSTCNVTVITGSMGDKAVYMGPRFAYHIVRPNKKFFEDVASHCIADVRSANNKYEVKDEQKENPGAKES
jgi:hypothetical protein